MDRRLLDLVVGLFVAVGLAALLFLALKVGSQSVVNATDVYSIKAGFDNIGGLKVRSAVKSAGVVVGRVSEIRFDDQLYEAIVTLKIEKNYRFPRDSSAAIVTSGLLGEQYIALDAGGDTIKLKDGDSLRLTQPAVVLESLIGQFLYNKAEEGSQHDANP
jgi:phospholipid/cholesterol/gamma-HCH transport system substrate-binding protein